MVTSPIDASNPSFVLDRDLSFRYEDRSTPAVQNARDVIVRIVATGVCGSDVHYWKHGRIGDYKVNGPLILGHESAGVVVSCGDGVKSLSRGDPVAVEPGVGCTTCEDCRSGKYNLCSDMMFAATPPYDGTLTKYYRVPEECCFKLPASVSMRDGALIEPLAIAVHCCKLAGDMQGKTVTVFGAGPVGQLCGSVARVFGANTVLVADIVASRLDFALRKGATHIYQMQKISCRENATKLLSSSEQHDGSDIVIDATGAQPCIETGIEALRRGGVFVQAGLGQPNIMFPVGLICDKEAVFRGSFRYGPGDYKLAIALVASGRVDLAGFVTQIFPFSEAQQAFETVSQKEGIKTIICGPDVTMDEVEWLFAYEPMPRLFSDHSMSRGGNVLGLNRTSDDLILAQLDPRWTSASDDKVMFDVAKQWLEQVKGYTESVGKASDFVYYNYADGFQDPIAGYGKESVQFLRRISKKYDANGVFQKALKGGFKIPGMSGAGESEHDEL